ncbi:MAG TPA: trypsin-like peptidase domain-containing protein [Polyangiaceae bacterium]|jgi:S1-C subfamily serine protease|nr:trypsin-like peptidase domain-containing protein [Polyangiaceae bacterium]
MPRTLAAVTKTVLSTTGFLLVAMSCDLRRKSDSLGPPPLTAAPLGSSSGTPLIPTDLPPLSPEARTEDEKNTINVFRSAARSTVFVTQNRNVVDYYGNQKEVAAGSGSGFVWDRDGHVVTNFHVVQGAASMTVTLQDHRTFEATVVGVEPRKDIAVLLIKAPRDALFPIQVPPEKARRLEVGQKTLAIGNPFGLDQTLTTGVVSAIGREVQGIGGVAIRDMVQTDAAINPGNSGGPLLDSSGRLIGMNTMIFSRSGASAGIGFAVPVSSIARVVPQIIRGGHAEQIGLGVQIDPAQRLEQRANIAGVIVLRVLPGTPAAAAGLRGIQQDYTGITLGDIIVAIDDDRIDSYDALYNTLDKHKAGEKVQVTTVRDGKKSVATISLVLLQASDDSTPAAGTDQLPQP